MANWYGSARSNFVRVKNVNAFRDWVETLPDVEIVERDDQFSLWVGSGSDSGGWPSVRWDDNDQRQDIDLAAEIAPHLSAGEVFIFCECGAEKLRYLTGWATAVNDLGETLQVSIEDIYALVRKRWNRNPTTAAC